MKKCLNKLCLIEGEQADSEFPRNPKTRMGRYCKTCLDRWYTNYVDSGKKRLSRRRDLLKKYGLTPEKYDEMLIRQNLRCAICFCPGSELRTEFFVDHCHETNRVRELLCRRCNTFIGLASENISTLKSAIEYLWKHKLLNLATFTKPLAAKPQRSRK